ncbi:Ldh family oxidoreductase [Geodermatophilus sp. URMC 64]
MATTDGVATRTVPVGVLGGVLADAFRAAGMGEPEAARVADALVRAETAGVPTHGVLRVPWYLDALAAGSVRPAGDLPVCRRTPGVATLDGGGAFGYLPTWVALQSALAMAGETGVACVAVSAIAEFGRAAYYAEEAAARGLVAVVCQNTLPLLAAPGADVATHGNNPLAFSGPGADAPVFDAAFSARSGGELRRRALLGLPLPPEWGYVDADGVPTTDPARAMLAAQQAVGGAKGFGIAVLVDLLAGVLSSSASGPAVRPGLPEVGALVLALDPAAFGTTPERVAEQFAAGARAVRASGGRWPGDRARAARRRAEEHGDVEVPVPVLDALAAAVGPDLAARLG